MPAVGDRVRFASRKIDEAPPRRRRDRRHGRTPPHQVVDGGGVDGFARPRGHRRRRQAADVIGQEGHGWGEGSQESHQEIDALTVPAKVLDARVTKQCQARMLHSTQAPDDLLHAEAAGSRSQFWCSSSVGDRQPQDGRPWSHCRGATRGTQGRKNCLVESRPSDGTLQVQVGYR